MNFYSKLLVSRPEVVLFVIFVFCFSCILTTFLLKSPPDFSEPTIGFETRGTEISKRLTTWRNIIEETRPSGSLIVNPKELLQHEFDKKKHHKNKNRHEKKKRLKFDQKMRKLKDYSTNRSFNTDIIYNSDDSSSGNDSLIEEHHYEYGKNVSYNEEKDKKNKKAKNDKWIDLLGNNPPPYTSTDFHSTDGYFCESPSKSLANYQVFVFNMLIFRQGICSFCN